MVYVMIPLEILQLKEVHHLFDLVLCLESHERQTLKELDLPLDLSVLNSFQDFVEIYFG